MWSLVVAAAVLLGPGQGDGREARLHDLTSEWECPGTRVLGPFHNLYNPRIVRVADKRYPYRMWFFGWAAEDNNPKWGGGDAIYHARSRDLKGWEVYAGDDTAGKPTWDLTCKPALWTPVVKPEPGVFTNAAAGDPSVVLRGKTYYMAFSSVGFDARATETPQHLYLNNCVMGARSTDGIHWTRTTAPILRWPGEETHRWDIAGGKNTNTPPPGFQGAYHRPSLLFDGGRWRLWFDYFLPGTFLSMGYAENSGDFMDPAQWRVIRAGDEPLLRDWPNPNVIRVGEELYSFSDAPNYPAEMGGDGRQITVARSKDGLAWAVLGHIRPEGRESSHVPEAFLQGEKDGLWLYVFYAWKPETVAGKAWDFRYREVRWVRKAVEGRRSKVER